jgi:two-component system, OmpR family, response regulator RegX3
MDTDLGRLRDPDRVLIVIEEPVLSDVVRLALLQCNVHAQAVQSGDEAVAALTVWRPGLAIVDADLGDGTILERLNGAAAPQDRLPILALTRQGDLQSKLTAFEQGADDFITVPFSPEELVARVMVIMRRSYMSPWVFMPVVRFGDLEIDILHRRVRADGQDRRLTSLELSLLYLLAANAGRLLTRDEILDHLWGVDYAAESNVVDRQIRNLRAKLGDDWRHPRYIATVPGQGYRFIPTGGDDTAEAPPP